MQEKTWEIFPFSNPAKTAAAAAAKSLQSCPSLCNPTDGSPPGSAVPGILQARTLEWVAVSFSNAWKWKWTRPVVSDSSRPHGLSLPGSSVHGIFQAGVLEWGAIAFSDAKTSASQITFVWWRMHFCSLVFAFSFPVIDQYHTSYKMKYFNNSIWKRAHKIHSIVHAEKSSPKLALASREGSKHKESTTEILGLSCEQRLWHGCSVLWETGSRVRMVPPPLGPCQAVPGIACWLH